MAKVTLLLSSKPWASLLGLVILLLSTHSTATAQCTLACNDLVQISLDSDCEVEIEPDMILEGGGCPNGNFVVEMKINGAWVPAIVNGNHINQTIQTRVRDIVSGNYCWGYIFVEDNLAPQMVCTNITLSCGITTYTPQYLEDELNIATAYPNVIENCGSYTSSYIDNYTDLGCNGTINGLNNISAYVRRTWTVVDQSGNTSSCSQYIYFQRRNVSQVLFPADITISCENPDADPSVTGTPYINDFGKQWPLYPQNTFCELNVIYSDQTLPICDGSHKILRTWTVLDWCLPTTPNPPFTNPKYYIQLIMVQDDQGPVMECPEDMTISTNSQDCESDFDLPDVIIEDACSRIKSIRAEYVVNGVGQVLNGTIQNFSGNNYWHPDTLGVLGYANNLPLGTTAMTYIVRDDCGNESSCQFNITVADETPPTAVCDEFTKVSLGNNGMILVNASTFDDGSYDNCSPAVYFKARRMDTNGCQPSNRFDDQVKFCCEDIGDTITVIFRVYDFQVPTGEVSLEFGEWNSNDCMVQVLVDDKLKPSCNPPANATTSCQNFDPSLWAYGFATSTDNCCIDTITETRNLTLFDTVCNRGTITRTFRAQDCGGLTSTCTQRVVINYNQSYFIRFPNDVIVTSCDGTGNFGAPTFFGQDCEMLGVSHLDQIFTVVPDACYKIERTWTIINWCTYNPNLGCTDVPNPNPNPITNHTSNLPGPTVSPAGTAAPWAPTVVAINPGETPTNYSVFWNANANCYKYKQIVKVIDTQAPIVENCPVDPVTACDSTANSAELWNESYWWDATTQSHNLCEGPANLSITATDLCSGANVNVKYFLFLDLDNDGDMETVVNSATPPGVNTVYFGNAQNPNFSGGTARQFDQRAVPNNQKYAFALQTAVSGNKKIASVRWNTTQTPNVFTVPELPYGTHKIKWIVDDGCGNERVCEYTFVVKDCKKPTVVCISGISVNIMPTKMITLTIGDFLLSTLDNCTPTNLLTVGIRKAGQGTGFPTNPNGTPQTSVTFDCTELGLQNVEIWSRDLAGNADFCGTHVTVQDNMGACGPAGSNATVAGFLKTEADAGLAATDIEIAATPPGGAPPYSLVTTTDNNGLYGFPNSVPMHANYTLTPTKDNDPLNGVSTFDLVLINKHILGLEPLPSPYKMIAADANGSRSITTFDIVELRKLILGIYTELPANTSWRFVGKNYAFPNPSNPFQDVFPETISTADVQASQVNDDFVAVKIGDVNGNAITNLTTTEDRTSGTTYFDLADRTVHTGEEITVRFRAADGLAAYQFTLNFNGLEIVDLMPGDNMTHDNFGVFAPEKTITVSADGGEGFAVQFRALQNGLLSQLLTVGSRVTKAEAHNAAGENLEVALRFNGANGAMAAGGGFDLFQNTPNPVKDATSIAFNLPEAANVTLTISNAEGRVLKTVKGNFAKGLSSVTVQRTELTSGMLFYQLDTPTHSAVRKIVVVD